MARAEFDYTEVAKRLSLKFPFLTTMLTQINFWVVSYILFGLVIYFNTLGNNDVYDLTIPIKLSEVFLVSIVIGVSFGSILGLLDFFTDPFVERLPLGLEVIMKAILYISAFTLIWFVGGNLWQELLEYRVGEPIDDSNLRFWFWGLFIYTLFSVLLISFIRQVNKSFGPGVLVPVLLGRYRQPSLQSRIFLFLDLRSSTAFAGKLGPELYSQLIQDCIKEANRLIPRFNAQIYQYVGDEIVLTWAGARQSDYFNAIGYFQSLMKRIGERHPYFEEKYGLVPVFKAGIHVGSVAVAEVGTIKREIAYHGEAVITASRLETSCNFFQVPVLVSEDFVQCIGDSSKLLFDYVAMVEIKGKTEGVRAYTLKESQLR